MPVCAEELHWLTCQDAVPGLPIKLLFHEYSPLISITAPPSLSLAPLFLTRMKLHLHKSPRKKKKNTTKKQWLHSVGEPHPPNSWFLWFCSLLLLPLLHHSLLVQQSEPSLWWRTDRQTAVKQGHEAALHPDTGEDEQQCWVWLESKHRAIRAANWS